MTVTETIAEFIASVQMRDVPEAAVEKLRLHIFDTVGAQLAGAQTADARAAAAVVDAMAGNVQASNGPAHSGMSLPAAVFRSIVSARCTEIDDIHIESCTTPGSVIVPAALCGATFTNEADGQEFLLACLAGYEVLTRFGQAIDGPVVLYRGIWPTYLCSVFGVVGALGRLLHLTATQLAHAVAVAATLARGTTGRVKGPTSRWLTLGCSVVDGVSAVFGAREGLHGDLSLLEGRWSEITGVAMKTDVLTERLGESFGISRVSQKPYCAAKQATAAICGFVDLLREEATSPNDIDEVVVAVPTHYAAMIDHAGTPEGRLASISSAQYQLALAALHPAELRDILREHPHNEPEFLRLMDKVKVVPDPSLDRHYPRAWPARVKLITRSGQTSKKVHFAKGDPDLPLTWDETIEKFRQVNSTYRGSNVDRIASICRQLGTGAELLELAEALRDKDEK